jgi:hypothetical protein
METVEEYITRLIKEKADLQIKVATLEAKLSQIQTVLSWNP